jgi:DNA-binding beta-propeller fold protein YncE
LAFADDIQFSGIVAGFVFDASSSSIRPILGVPGAAMLGSPVAQDINAAEIAPGGDRAVVSRGGRLHLISGLRSGSPAWTAIAGLSNADQFIWNSAGSAAALYSSDTGALLLIRILGDGSLEEFSLDVSLLGSAMGPILVDHDGRYLVAMTASEPATLYVLDRQSAPKRIAQFDRPGPMSFAGNERDVLVVDANRRQIMLIQDVFGTAGALPFGALPDGATTPAGLAVSPDETRVFVADRASRQIAVYDMGTRNMIDQIPLDAEPAFVKRFSKDSLFLLNSSASGSEPFQLLETGDKPSVYFVPAGATQSQ